MATNFMPELDPVQPLTDLLTDDSHLSQMTLPAPKKDYSNWDDKRTVVKLMNVRWTADDQLVDWQSEARRDAWFDQKTGDDVYTYETNWNVLGLENYSTGLGIYKGSLTVDLPIEQALGYNYVAIDRYDQPVQVDGSPVRNRFFYFITGVEAKPVAPSTTKLIIELDAWTEYVTEGWDGVAIDLERGHWPTSQVTTSQWLSDPLGQLVDLTEPEPDLPQLQPMVSWEHLTPLYGSSPLFIMCFTTDLSRVGGLWSDGQAHDPSPQWWLRVPDVAPASDPGLNQPEEWTFINDNLGVPGGAAGGGHVTWSNEVNIQTEVHIVDALVVDDQSAVGGVSGAYPVTPADPTSPDGNVDTGLFAYAIQPSDIKAFKEALAAQWPQVLLSFKASFVVPSEFVELGTPLVFAGTTLRTVTTQNTVQQLSDIGITPDMFNWSEDWTKLYTGQFCSLEISDLKGQRVSVNLQDVSKGIQVNARLNAAFPFLKFEAFITGVGGSKSNEYNIMPLTAETASMPVSLWEDLHFDWDIPTFGLFIDGRTGAFDAAASLYQSLQVAARSQALAINQAYLALYNGYNDLRYAVDYGQAAAQVDLANGTQSANTTLTNGNAQADMVYGNTARSVSTAYSNAMLSASNTRTNATLDNDRAHTTTTADLGLAQDNSNASNEKDHEVIGRTLSNARTNSNTSNDNAKANNQKSADTSQAVANLTLAAGDSNYMLQNSQLQEREAAIAAYNVVAFLAGGSGLALQPGSASSSVAASPNSMPDNTGYTLSVAGTVTGSGPSVNELGNSNGSEMVGVSTNTAVAQNAILAAAGTAYEIANFAIASSQIAQSQLIFDTQLSGSRDAAYDQANTLLNNNFNTADTIITADFQTGTLNEQDRFITTQQIIQRVFTVGTSNEALRYSTQSTIIGNNYSTASSVASNTRATGDANNASTYATTVANLARSNATTLGNLELQWWLNEAGQFQMKYKEGTVNLNNSFSVALAQARTAWENERLAVSTRLSQALAREPRQLGSWTGDGSTDQWARRGVDIRARRISPADEQSVIRCFRRWGYRMPLNTWVQPLALVAPNERFWFWKARDVWATSTKMSETARRTIYDKLVAGATIWSDPDNVMGVVL